MNVTCTHCRAVYRVDPAKVPSGGVLARCSQCSGAFPVPPADRPAEVPAAGVMDEAPAAAPAGGSAAAEGGAEPKEPAPPEPVPAAARAAQPEPGSSSGPGSFSPFGSTDPHTRARRLARALVSDIVVYHPDRHQRSQQEGTLRQEFRDEIRKSWEEYAGQVGDELARGTPYFREALNELLARGDRVF